MRIHINITDGTDPATALECVLRVVRNGRISKGGKMYCYVSIIERAEEDIYVICNDYRKSDCFRVYTKTKGK